MEIGNEIGQKIRSAIRAKLVELGAYVDDELPDYVMVMVANRKSEAQMCEDLSLFLGSNTSKFTSWLNGLLQKLLSITSETERSVEETEKPKAVESQTLLEATASALKEKEDALSEMSEEVQTAKSAKSRGGSVLKKKEVIAVQQPELAIEDEPVIRLRLEHDEFEEETRGMSEDVKDYSMSKAKAETVKQFNRADSLKKFSKDGSSGNSGVTGGGGGDDDILPMKSSSRNPVRQSSKDAPERKSSFVLEERADGRHRSRALESSVGAVVVKHNIDEVEEEEAYDPLRPSIGSVASVVKVTERKSSVPPSLQANRTLLLLAMKEAEKSVAKFRKSSSVSEDEVNASAQGKHSNSVNSSSKKRPDRPEAKRLAVEPSVKEIPLTSLTNQTVREGRRCRKSQETGDEENAKTVDVVRGKVVTEDKQTKAVERSASGRNIVLTDEVQNKTTAAEDDVSEEQQLRRILIQQQSLPTERTSSPKFVVTLDGIFQNALSENSDLLQMEDEEYEEEEDLSIRQMDNIPRNVVRVTPQMQIVEEETANEEFEEENSEFEPMSKKSKLMERCKYWPLCKNGDSCPFHHPSIPCKMFPSCRFGDKCLYLHPSCKFDSVCRNPSCPYLHSTPHHPLSQPVPVIMPIRMPIFSFPSSPMFAPVRHRVTAPGAAQPRQTRCRFFPNCTDMNCVFLHPKPCRYGLSCASKKSCPFAHPQLPTKKQLKWVSTSAQQENL